MVFRLPRQIYRLLVNGRTLKRFCAAGLLIVTLVWCAAACAPSTREAENQPTAQQPPERTTGQETSATEAEGASEAEARPADEAKTDPAQEFVKAGLAHFAEKEYDEAVEAFMSALSLEPDNPQYQFNLDMAIKTQRAHDEGYLQHRPPPLKVEAEKGAPRPSARPENGPHETTSPSPVVEAAMLTKGVPRNQEGRVTAARRYVDRFFEADSAEYIIRTATSQIADEHRAAFREFVRTYDWDPLKEQVVQVMANNYTVAEIRALASFYLSDAGQSLLEKQNRGQTTLSENEKAALRQFYATEEGRSIQGKQRMVTHQLMPLFNDVIQQMVTDFQRKVSS
jgi:hypothetical protein